LKGREALIAEEQKRRHGKISAISLINNLNFF
jgi:hypothetical protein